MALQTPNVDVINIFRVGGLLAVITGGGSGLGAMMARYTASKAAVVHLMKSLSTLLGKFDIRYNIIAPGLYYTELAAPAFEKPGINNGHEEGKFDGDTIPATRSGHEEDIAGAILWLCSKAGAYVNGNIVVTDGGRLGVVPSSY